MSTKCIECTSCFADVEFGAFSTTNYIYDVISLAIKMFGNIDGAFRSSTEVQMKVHILHRCWLHGVVPGVLVAIGRRVDRSNVSRLFVSRLYAIGCVWLKILIIFVHARRKQQLVKMILRLVLYAISCVWLTILISFVLARRKQQFVKMIVRTRIVENVEET